MLQGREEEGGGEMRERTAIRRVGPVCSWTGSCMEQLCKTRLMRVISTVKPSFDINGQGPRRANPAAAYPSPERRILKIGSQC
jgi:hypothetical protein